VRKKIRALASLSRGRSRATQTFLGGYLRLLDTISGGCSITTTKEPDPVSV
jgi:hypothetical protein